MEKYYSIYYSKIGKIKILSDENNIIGVSIEGQESFDKISKENIVKNDEIQIIRKTKLWLDKYFKKEEPKISELSLKFIGGEFRKLVWKELCQIPYGELITYGEIAKKISKIQNIKSMSAQAVGGAVRS